MSETHHNIIEIGQYLFAASYCISRFEFLLKEAMSIPTVTDCFSKHKQELEGLCENFVIQPELYDAEDFFEFMCGIDQDARYEENPLALYNDATAHISHVITEDELKVEDLSKTILALIHDIENVIYEFDCLGILITTSSLLHKGLDYLKAAFSLSNHQNAKTKNNAVDTATSSDIIYAIYGDARKEFVQKLMAITRVIILAHFDGAIRIKCPETTLSFAKKTDISEKILEIYSGLNGSIQITIEKVF